MPVCSSAAAAASACAWTLAATTKRAAAWWEAGQNAEGQNEGHSTGGMAVAQGARAAGGKQGHTAASALARKFAVGSCRWSQPALTERYCDEPRHGATIGRPGASGSEPGQASFEIEYKQWVRDNGAIAVASTCRGRARRARRERPHPPSAPTICERALGPHSLSIHKFIGGVKLQRAVQTHLADKDATTPRRRPPIATPPTPGRLCKSFGGRPQRRQPRWLCSARAGP